ncbi:MAG: 30S ribosomal protein S8 [Candidatus Portnoybacteria bacterium CG10_big_fil_rev_8_21_14_0_10_36_7]|uniref:Small ribosomal subunit protein uS8 n=1 Tax=Candidatus Portnoybacteria bacterium CG10_big_fil_rev_8_21_14_0_10_36_7 TaxID=1974812 RepID=A0A2M8KDI2_9BACT|nr:MAG: 30S ribosomal protein S8 [Candidatus Portnoybacteria bacterium CG10_big_fil_rev_8_21_14_0_10_36_7]
MTDPISDFLARIRNAQMRGHDQVYVPFSALKQELAKTLEKNGYIAGMEKIGKEKAKEQLVINLKYDVSGNPAIVEAKKISKPGQRIYIHKDKIHPQQFILRVISTSKGLMSDKEAKKVGLGGELMCEIK